MATRTITTTINKNSNMPPNNESQLTEELPTEENHESETSKTPQVPVKIVWRNVILFVYLHMAALYGLYLLAFEVSYQTTLWTLALYLMSGMGITAGAHRLWAHRCYKARLPLRIWLCFCNSIAFQNHIYEWARDHRVHHKFSETDADPHNARRGFFFSHMGWLLTRKHPEVIRKGKTVDMSDLLSDPVVMFQKKFYLPLVLLCSFVFPMAVPVYFWGENTFTAFFVCSLFRYTFVLHGTWLVNSAAHMWGNKPYDKKINPSESVLANLFTGGEGFHNYHHTFPWDYSASEWGTSFNLSTYLIEMWEKMGLAYDLKKVPRDIINRRRERTGDGSDPWYPEKLNQLNELDRKFATENNNY